MSQFAKTLKQLMEQRKVTGKVLCNATGVPSSTLSEWISGTREPKLNDTKLGVARFFGVSIEYLLTGEASEI